MSTNRGLSSFVRKLFGPGQRLASSALVGPEMVVTPDSSRCVQCGVCSYNCPVGIPVRDYARQGLVVNDARCVQCGQCVVLCPRGTLRWAPDPRPQRQRLAELDAQLSTEGILLAKYPPARPGNG